MAGSSRFHFGQASAARRRIVAEKIIGAVDRGQFGIVRLGIQH
jgi:hypothetical protein